MQSPLSGEPSIAGDNPLYHRLWVDTVMGACMIAEKGQIG
jgi:hypothetical protein